ncbi:hypothetical protein PMAYCL1PPCAC_17548, partial [Pristionchus mayeri]
ILRSRLLPQFKSTISFISDIGLTENSNFGLRTKWMSVENIEMRLKRGDLIEISRIFPIGFLPLPYKHWAVFTCFREGNSFAVHYSDTSDDDSHQFPQEQILSIKQPKVREERLKEIIGSSKCRINNSQDWK